MNTEKFNQRTTPNRHWVGLLTGSFLMITLLGSSFSFADPTLRYQRASGRVERRDERSSGRIEHRQERYGSRVERRDERITNRIERRDMFFSPPEGATAVSVEGTKGYKVGEDVYKPAISEGETVYIKVDIK